MVIDNLSNLSNKKIPQQYSKTAYFRVLITVSLKNTLLGV